MLPMVDFLLNLTFGILKKYRRQLINGWSYSNQKSEREKSNYLLALKIMIALSIIENYYRESF